MKRHLLKLYYSICIVLAWSESQLVFNYMEYLKSLFDNYILKCYSNNINETRCNSLLPMCKGLRKKVLSNTLEADILLTLRPECKVCELRYRPFGTLFFIQQYNVLFLIQKKNVSFNIYYLLFQNHFFLVNSSNLMDTIKTIVVLIELQLNSTVIS